MYNCGDCPGDAIGGCTSATSCIHARVEAIKQGREIPDDVGKTDEDD